ncbi:right-handed parallel beta-helix repeat-containing protein [Paucihalobacter sp.]|uniref:right-handed parallel beta-helix repeat-containing protein n=1 Tax=Paucihalobacter sp. TaxID=2850405 RepID=UPI002FE3DEE5
MKTFVTMLLAIIFAISTFFSCYTESLNDSIEDSLIENIDDEGTVNEQFNVKIIQSDFDWNNIPDSYSNSIWEISNNYELEGLSILLPKNVTLKFTGGSLNNYASILGENTKIDAGLVGSFDGSGVFEGTWNLEKVYPEWFGAVGDGSNYDADAFISAVNFLMVMGGGNLILTTGKDYVIDKEILLYSNISVLGNSANISVAQTTYDVSPNRFFAIFTTVHLDKRPHSAPAASFATGIIQFSNIHIKDITFKLNRDGTTMALGWMLSSDFNAIRFVDTENSTVENCHFIDKQTSDIWTLLAVVTFEKSNNCKAINNTFNRCTAIAISEGTANIIDGNVMNNSPGTQIEVFLGTHHQVINNTTNEQWYAVSTIGSSAKYSLVSNNTINESSLSAITMGHKNEVVGTDYGADYSIVENNYITGGVVGTHTGRVGIFLQNGKGIKVINNTIRNLFKGATHENQDAAILISGARTVSEQVWHDDLIVEGNTIASVTTAIQLRDIINANISNNIIDNVYVGIYGESNAANSPNSKLILDNNQITDSNIAFLLNGPDNVLTNNEITRVDQFGNLHYGHYVFNSNIIKECLIGPNSLHPLSFTMRDNYFYNSIPLGTLEEGSMVTMRAPNMAVNNLIIEGNIIDSPNSIRPTTWVLRAFELQGFAGSQYFN